MLLNASVVSIHSTTPSAITTTAKGSMMTSALSIAKSCRAAAIGQHRWWISKARFAVLQRKGHAHDEKNEYETLEPHFRTHVSPSSVVAQSAAACDSEPVQLSMLLLIVVVHRRFAALAKIIPRLAGLARLHMSTSTVGIIAVVVDTRANARQAVHLIVAQLTVEVLLLYVIYR